MESRACGNWFAVLSAVIITLSAIFAGCWLWKMTDVLKPSAGQIVMCYGSLDCSPGGDKSSETEFVIYKQAEETLRGQMNT